MSAQTIPPANPIGANTDSTQPTLSPISQAEAAITAALRQIHTKIAEYPGPIAGCDAQFNHLLESRRRLERARTELGCSGFVPPSRHHA
ncbi:hypothetical protein [Puniceibacterium sp. IMCC21224]|uniref:hypothetical protein n=1 Tax=Puniceibacterium sp. IMCC21224 TaxID=1618204 RepID=UPI00065D2A92|nr:hypothetical protein [Puniceibacterium sp. IMCC21224]KMK68822.1 hypothetical protein IMCC21224_113708 [Puniceibacterium sp. IMCC21224]